MSDRPDPAIPGVRIHDDDAQLLVSIDPGAMPDLNALFALRHRFDRELNIRLASDAGPMTSSLDTIAVQLLDLSLEDALRLDASQIHFEPQRSGIRIRIRVRGVLRDAALIALPLGQRIIDRLTAQAAPRSRESGEYGSNPPYVPASRSAAFLVAHLPCRLGTRVVLSLDQNRRRMPLIGDLGASASAERAIGAALDGSNGLILIAGPPHSGRRATVQAMLGELAAQGRSVLSIERPAAALLEGVGQVELGDDPAKSRINALHAMLRQDPDVLAVDAIPDRATAERVVEAALDRRLVIARINAPDAMTAIDQLRSLKVDPFLIATALRAVTAQRLARRLCSECRRAVQAPASVSALLGFDPGTIIFEPQGCSACDETGFDGTVAVFEVVQADQTIRRLINSGGDAAILARHAFVNAPNLGSAARSLVREGVITADDAVRLSRGEPLLL